MVHYSFCSMTFTLVVVILAMAFWTTEQSTPSPTRVTTPAPAYCFSSIRPTCEYTCHCAGGAACDDRTGGCPGGCADGWSGDACQTGNVAQGKTAYQVSDGDLESALEGSNIAANCVDGSDSMDETLNTCCAVPGDRSSLGYWEVHLGGSHVVEEIILTASNQQGGNAIRNVRTILYYQDEQVHVGATTAAHDLAVRTVTLPSGLVADRVRIQKINKGYILAMCEVSVIGYPYTECEQYQGNYYYGPACLHDCGCEVAQQCHNITGDVTCSCKAGYIPIGRKCVPCASGTWGARCAHTCNCMNRHERCHHVDGACLVSGCREWYANTGCDHALPRLGSRVEPEVTVDGRSVTVQLVLDDSSRRRRAVGDGVEYRIGYRVMNVSDDANVDDDLSYLDEALVPSNGGAYTGTGTLPTLRERYVVCVVPYDLEVEEAGKRSDCVEVWTECINGDYGKTDCNNICTCRDVNEICDKETGACNDCNSDVTGLDCKLRIPDENSIVVQFVAKVTDIEITIETTLRYVKEYVVMCRGGNAQNYTQTVQYLQEGSVIVRVKNLQNSTEYNCYVTPVLFDDYGTYPGEKLWQETVTTKQHYSANSDSNSSSNNSNMIPTVIGVVVAVVVVVAVAGAIVFMWLRKKRSSTNDSVKSNIANSNKKNSYVHGNAGKADDQMYENVAVQIDNEDQTTSPDVYQIPHKTTVAKQIESDEESKLPVPGNKPVPSPETPPAVISAVSYFPIKLKDFAQYMANINATDYDLDVEFSEIPEGSAPCKTGEKPEHSEKHRFLNIKAYDHSRVQLDVMAGEDPDSDYINACYIRDYYGNRTVIASQAPRVPTIDDMWRMIWQENVNQIVMLTKLKEGNKVKCQRYWPVEGEKEYAEITVELLSSISNSFYIERRMRVTKGDKTRMITQLQYTNWPDHGVPQSAHEVLYFYYKVKSLEQSRTGRLLVHCSAGVGRTGTFIGLEWLLCQCRSEKRVDMVKCVRSMREDRTLMVQNVHQYRFLYQLLYEALTIGNTTITNDNYKIFMVATSHEAVTRNQLSQINKIYPTDVSADHCSDALRQENKNKTRGGADNAPSNSKRLFLSTPVPDHNDYINAVQCLSFNQEHSRIMTQIPLSNTVADMWRLVYDHSVHGIVLLQDMPSDEVPYWPTDDEPQMSFGPLNVEFVGESSKIYDWVTVRDFTVQHNSNPDDVRKIRQWHLNNWGTSDTSVSPALLAVLVDLSTQYANKMAADATVVQCLDGITRSGLYVAYNNLLEMMLSTKTIDVCFVIRQIRSIRPQAIRSVEQLQLLYQWMEDALSDTQEYYN